MSRRRQRGPARCLSCSRPVVLFGSPFTGKWRTFEPTPVDPTLRQDLSDVFPVEGRRAWKPRELVEDLMVRRRVTQAGAEREVYDMTWYQLHRCPDDESRPHAAARP